MSLLRAISDDERFVGGGGGGGPLVATRMHGARCTVNLIKTGRPLFSSLCIRVFNPFEAAFFKSHMALNMFIVEYIVT
jgi:hypothetical protein